MTELNDEQQKRLDKAKAGAGLICATCSRPIDMESEDVYSTSDGRLWCNWNCMSRPKVLR